MTDDTVIRSAARAAARRKLHDLFAEHMNPTVADQIADATLDAALPLAEGLRLFAPDADGHGHPVEWEVYNAMHKRALDLEEQLQWAIRRMTEQS